MRVEGNSPRKREKVRGHVGGERKVKEGGFIILRLIGGAKEREKLEKLFTKQKGKK